jgi:hypothetical protein
MRLIGAARSPRDAKRKEVGDLLRRLDEQRVGARTNSGGGTASPAKAMTRGSHQPETS